MPFDTRNEQVASAIHLAHEIIADLQAGEWRKAMSASFALHHVNVGIVDAERAGTRPEVERRDGGDAA